MTAIPEPGRQAQQPAADIPNRFALLLNGDPFLCDMSHVEALNEFKDMADSAKEDLKERGERYFLTQAGECIELREQGALFRQVVRRDVPHLEKIPGQIWLQRFESGQWTDAHLIGDCL